MTDHRMDGWARRLARPAKDDVISSDLPVVEDSLLEGVAKAVAAPITRRRAVAVIGGTVLAGSLLRPGRANAGCFPGGPKVCSNPKGARVCVPSDLACCSNENCAIACPYPWRVCASPAVCNDTARMCSDPEMRRRANVSTPNATQFCSMTLTVVNGCVEGRESRAIRGWCCRPNDECVLLRDRFGTCHCPQERECGERCCPDDEVCVTTRGGRFCKRPCPPGRRFDIDGQCVCESGAMCGLRCCPEGQVCDTSAGRRCVTPTIPPNPLRQLWDAFTGYGDAVNQAAGSRAGGNQHRIAFLSAGLTPVGTALLQLAAVSAQGVAAAGAFTGFHSDRAYRSRVVAATPRRARLAGTPGFNPGAARALDALLDAEAKAFAQVAAAGTALARSRGALRARDNTSARRQALAAAGFASAAAGGLRRVPGLRANAARALRAAGIPEVNVDPADAYAYRESARTGGPPADLTALLQGLGVTGADLRRAREAFAPVPTGGPALIAPLADPARTANLRSLAQLLATYARDVRRTPIRRSSTAPLKVSPPRSRTR
jgi:hypothetical protein